MQSTINSLPLISLMIMTLPIGAALIWLLPNEKNAKYIALTIAAIDLMLSLIIVFNFDDSQAGFQFVESREWIPSLGINYLVGVDGISVLFLPLTILLFNAVVLASWNSIHHFPRLYYTLLMVLESATLGIFCSLDTMLFFFFWELTLIPIYFLISLWGIGPHRRYAAVKYTLFMMTGGVALLFAFLVLAFTHSDMSGIALPQGLVFDYRILLEHEIPVEVQTLVFFLLFIGFAVKIPVFPLHTWLPTLALEGPVAVAAFMTGLKLGVYGLIRFVIPLAPQAASEYHWLLAGFGIIGLLYGALAALSQTNLRRMLAFASLSHVGMVVLGLASFNIYGIQGAVFQLINFSIVSTGLFLIAGFIQHRTGSTDIISLGGLAKKTPLMASFFLLFGLASIGLPGTNGFPAELLLLIGIFSSHTGAGIAALLGIILGAGYFLGMYRKAFLGPIHNKAIQQIKDLRQHELLIMIVLSILVLVFGLWPNIVLDIIRQSTQAWVSPFL